MIAKVTLDNSIGYLGSRHVVMAMDLHNYMANGRWPSRLKDFWPWLAAKLKKFQVRVLMGDFNMSLFDLVPNRRSCGVVIDVAAWYPWKSEDGEPMADSCGIFFIDTPGEYKLHHGLDDIHDDTEDGVLYIESAVAGSLESRRFDYIPANGGPGQALSCYLPKMKALDDKLKDFLTPSAESAIAVKEAARAAVAAKGDKHTCKGKGKSKDDDKGKGKSKDDDETSHAKVKEKRLAADLWRVKSVHHRGSHFPICAFLNHVGRRSPERLEARWKRGL